MQNSNELWAEVEQLQEKLHDVISKKGVNSPEALRVSQEFRNKMKEYNELKNR